MATVHVLKGKCLNPVDSVAKPISKHHSNLTCWREYGLGMKLASFSHCLGMRLGMRLVILIGGDGVTWHNALWKAEG